METTETHCHCGANFRGSDHCPECFCEQFEATCDHESMARQMARFLASQAMATA